MYKTVSLNVVLATIVTLFLVGCGGKEPASTVSGEGAAYKEAGDDRIFDGSGHHPHHKRHPLLAALNLSKEQMEQIKAMYESHQDEFKALKESFSKGSSWKEKKAAFKEIKETIFKEILAILTPEQQNRAEYLKGQLDQGIFPPELVKNRVARLTENLGLSADQQQQITALFVKRGQERLDNKKKGAKGNGKYGKKFHHKNKGKSDKPDGELLKILNDDQIAIFKEMMAKKREHMRKHYQKEARRRIQQRIRRLTAALDLTKEQQQQLREIFRSVREEIPGKDHAEVNHGQRNAKKKKLQHLINKKIAAILNDEQLAKFKELQKKRKKHRKSDFHHDGVPAS